MQWHDVLKQAEDTEHQAREQLDIAETYYARAIEMAQSVLGPYDVNLAKCFLAFAHFLEQQQRYPDALLRYKLAASIYKQSGHTAAYSLAKNKVDRLEILIAQMPQL
jgi:tetratricopeptide (TPR) repeat protein